MYARLLMPRVRATQVIGWLDAGQPDPEKAPERIGQVLDSIVKAAGSRLTQSLMTEGIAAGNRLSISP